MTLLQSEKQQTTNNNTVVDIGDVIYCTTPGVNDDSWISSGGIKPDTAWHWGLVIKKNTKQGKINVQTGKKEVTTISKFDQSWKIG